MHNCTIMTLLRTSKTAQTSICTYAQNQCGVDQTTYAYTYMHITHVCLPSIAVHSQNRDQTSGEDRSRQFQQRLRL
eukprot:m.109045 g.109045  ORF g.109045 m.109045 type:complete len:76 (-) comp13362_c0_seq1:2012-2239(-)